MKRPLLRIFPILLVFFPSAMHSTPLPTDSAPEIAQGVSASEPRTLQPTPPNAVSIDTCDKEEVDASIKDLHTRMLSEVQRYVASRESGMAHVTNCHEIAENPTRKNPCGTETRVTFQCTVGSFFVPWEHQVKADATGSTDRTGNGFLAVVAYVVVLDETEPTLGKPGREHWRSQPEVPMAEHRRQRIADCRVDFALPADWQIDVRETKEACRIRVRPGNWKEEVHSSEVDLADYPLEIQLSFGPFLRAAEQSGFGWSQGRWMAFGRQGMESDVTEIRGKGWSGLQASPQIGMHYKRGGYAGLGDTDRILIQAKNGRIAFVEGLGLVHDSLTKIIETFVFLP